MFGIRWSHELSQSSFLYSEPRGSNGNDKAATKLTERQTGMIVVFVVVVFVCRTVEFFKKSFLKHKQKSDDDLVSDAS